MLGLGTRFNMRTIIFSAFLFGFVLAITIFPSETMAARISVLPSTQSISEGESAIFEVRLNTEREQINALELHGQVTSGAGQMMKIEKSESIFSVFPELPMFSGDSFSFFGAIPNGFVGEGVVGRITVTGKRLGEFSIMFSTSSRVFLNSNSNLPADLSFAGGTLKVLPKDSSYIALRSETHPNQGEWSLEKSFQIAWDTKEDENYSYRISKLADELPDAVPDMPVGDIKFRNLDDGIYYFSVCAVENGKCGQISKYRAMIDTTPPEWVSIDIGPGTEETAGKRSVSFLAQDKGSGIQRYEASFEIDGELKTASSPIILESNARGTLRLIAFDAAGNNIERMVIIPSEKTNTYLPKTLIVLGLMLFVSVLWLVFRRDKKVLYRI